VSLTVSGRDLVAKVTKELGGLDKVAKDTGEKAGEKLAEGVTKKTRAAGKKAAKDIADGVAEGAAAVGDKLAAPIEAAAKAAGEKAGDKLAAGISDEAKAAGVEAGAEIAKGVDEGAGAVGQKLGGDLAATARASGDKAGAELAKAVENRTDGLGKRIGASLEDAARSAGGRLQGVFGDVVQRSTEASRKIGESLSTGLSSGIGSVAKTLAVAFAGVQVGSFLKGAVEGAADTGEQLSKLTALVGDSADELNEWSKTTAATFGISRREALSAAGTFANFFRGVGQSQQQAAEMSKSLVILAADMASFGNATPEEALEALGAALRGEAEPLTKFGVLLNDATLKQAAFRLGLTENAKADLTPAIKVQAVYAETLRQTAIQQGDAVRTGGQLAGQQRRLTAEFGDAQAALGQALLPAMLDFVNAGRDLVPLLEAIGPVVGTIATAAGAAAGPLASIAKSDFGQFGLTAGAAFVAVDKLSNVLPVLQSGIEKVATAANVSQAAVTGFAGLISSALLNVYSGIQQRAAEAEARQQELTTAMQKAHDPATQLAFEYGKLAEQLNKIDASNGAAEAIESVNERAIASKVGAKDLGGALDDLGLSTADLLKVVQAGNGTFDKFEQKILSAAAAGDIAEDKGLKLIQVIREQQRAYRDHNKVLAEKVRAGLEVAISDGLVERGMVDSTVAAQKLRTEDEKLLAAAQVLADQSPELAKALKDTGVAGGGAAGGIGNLNDAVGNLPPAVDPAAKALQDMEDAQKAAKKAADDHKKALDDLSDGISGFVDNTFNAIRADDAWTEQFNDFITKIEDRKQAIIDARVEALGKDATDGMKAAAAAAPLTAEELASVTTTKGLSGPALENRKALDGLVQLAIEQINALVKAGAPIEDIITRGSFLAGELATNASNLGLAAPDVQIYTDAINGAVKTAGILNAQLSALPTNLSIDIAYTLSLNADQFKEELAIASQAFKDELSAKNVRLGIVDGPAGFEFALPGRAIGGPVTGGSPYLIGERGPELFVPDVNGTVVANNKMALVGAGAGGPAVSVGAINVTEAQSAAAVIDEVNARLGWQLNRRNV
jgi:hypothetical protein